MKITAKVLDLKETERDGQTLTSLALLIEGRKMWTALDTALITLSGDKKTAELDTTKFEIDPVTNAKGQPFLKLMPKSTISISHIAQARARVQLQVAPGEA